MVDLSDGLSSDLGHIGRESEVAAVLQAADLPCGPGASLDDALAGGDDYELCFTAPDPSAVQAAFAGAGLTPPFAIGAVEEGEGVFIADPGEARRRLLPAGWEHDIS